MCTVLYCTVLYYTVLYCTVLYCTVLYCIELLPPGDNQTAVNKYININISQQATHQSVTPMERKTSRTGILGWKWIPPTGLHKYTKYSQHYVKTIPSSVNSEQGK